MLLLNCDASLNIKRKCKDKENKWNFQNTKQDSENVLHGLKIKIADDLFTTLLYNWFLPRPVLHGRRAVVNMMQLQLCTQLSSLSLVACSSTVHLYMNLYT